MFRPRVIPVLLLKDNVLVKSIKFKNHKYIGDPINAVRIFNGFSADELVLLDIDASRKKKLVSVDFVKHVGEESNMPFAVGGGIRSITNIKDIINAGAEKVVIGSYASENPNFILEASGSFGSSTICVCIDVKRSFLGKKRTWVLNATKSTQYSPVEFAKLMEQKGAGEIIIQCVDRDGLMEGYDIEQIKEISENVSIPVIALGGAGKLEHLNDAYNRGYANGLAAGSMFVYQSIRRGVLINYPEKGELNFKK